LYVFCGDFPPAAKPKPSSTDACKGTEERLERLVNKRWSHHGRYKSEKVQNAEPFEGEKERNYHLQRRNNESLHTVLEAI